MNTQILCKFRGGSHAYGLSTPKSDVDWRGVFLNTEVKHLIGLSKFEHSLHQDAERDESFKEFRHALQLLRNANTEMVEMLFLDENQFDVLTPAWQKVVYYRSKLVSSSKLFSCLRGYMQGERRLANGERTGRLGGKRKEAIDQFGFSPKNFTQLLRLAWAGTIYFKKGIFPVNVGLEDPEFQKELMAIKTQPTLFCKQELNDKADLWESRLVESFENRTIDTKFDEDLADNLCLRFYAPLISQAYMRYVFSV